jgi:hypothetical protein
MYIHSSFFYDFQYSEALKKSLHVHELSIAVDGWVGRKIFSGGWKKYVEIRKKLSDNIAHTLNSQDIRMAIET